MKSSKKRIAKKQHVDLEKLVLDQSKKIELLEKQIKTQNSRFANMMEKIEDMESMSPLLEEILYMLSQQQKSSQDFSSQQLDNTNLPELLAIIQNRFPYDV